MGSDYLHKATFGGNADGVGLDVNGNDRQAHLQARTGQSQRRLHGPGRQRPAACRQRSTEMPPGSTGYPAAGDLGGQIRARNIKKLTVKPANVLVQTAQNPDFVQLQEQGYPTYVASPGYSLTNAVITTSGSIGQVNISGTQLNTEIKTGFDYHGLCGRTGRDPRSQRDRHCSSRRATWSTAWRRRFRPANNHYSHATGTDGPGEITVRSRARKYDTGGTTGLGNTGSGLFARHIRALRRTDEAARMSRVDRSTALGSRIIARACRSVSRLRPSICTHLTIARGPCPSSGRPRSPRSG